jgi:hypothetical protein
MRAYAGCSKICRRRGIYLWECRPVRWDRYPRASGTPGCLGGCRRTAYPGIPAQGSRARSADLDPSRSDQVGQRPSRVHPTSYAPFHGLAGRTGRGRGCRETQPLSGQECLQPPGATGFFPGAGAISLGLTTPAGSPASGGVQPRGLLQAGRSLERCGSPFGEGRGRIAEAHSVTPPPP